MNNILLQRPLCEDNNNEDLQLFLLSSSSPPVYTYTTHHPPYSENIINSESPTMQFKVTNSPTKIYYIKIRSTNIVHKL